MNSKSIETFFIGNLTSWALGEYQKRLHPIFVAQVMSLQSWLFPRSNTPSQPGATTVFTTARGALGSQLKALNTWFKALDSWFKALDSWLLWLLLFWSSTPSICASAWIVISLRWLVKRGLGLITPTLCFQFRVFPHGHHMFDEILEITFIPIFQWLTFTKR